MQEEAAEANRRLTDVLLSINNDKIISAASPVRSKQQREYLSPHRKQNESPDYNLMDEDADEYSNDFEDSKINSASVKDHVNLPVYEK